MSASPVRTLLFVPETRHGHGTGHIARCSRLANALGADIRSAILLRNLTGRTGDDPGGVVETVRKFAPDLRILREIPDRESFDLIVLDLRECSRELVALLRQFGPILGIDAMGSGRPYCSILFDLLPQPSVQSAPNQFAPGFLAEARGSEHGQSAPFGDQRPDEIGNPCPGDGTQPAKTILISFGGEDPAHLTEKVLRRRVRLGLTDPQRIVVVRGPMFAPSRLSGAAAPAGVRILDRPTGLRDQIASAGIVVTSFGITAFEARALGTPCLLVNPSKYHEVLSRQCGFLVAGIGRPRVRRFRSVMERWNRTGEMEHPRPTSSLMTSEIEWPGENGLARLLSTLDVHDGGGCPVCRSKLNHAVDRFDARSYFRCRTCRALYMESFAPKRVEYDRDYFFSSYEQQYGRTYLDDFDNIRKLAAARLLRIRRWRSNGAVLDVGCAYGPFLYEAREKGYEPHGVDISEDAARYVRETLDIPAVAASIFDFEPGRTYDIVTLWYVIEHFPDVGRLLTRLNRLLAKGGVLAFSTPSGSGISARRNRRQFLFHSPADHYTIWEPARTRHLLSRFGFELRRVRSTGHHPERFIRSGGRSGRMSRPARFLYTAASRLFGLGDTFEAYAVKTREIPE